MTGLGGLLSLTPTSPVIAFVAYDPAKACQKHYLDWFDLMDSALTRAILAGWAVKYGVG